MACVFLEIGQDVYFVGGDLTEAVNEGVRRGYDKGYLRNRCYDPAPLQHFADNTSGYAVHWRSIPRQGITNGPKGFGRKKHGARSVC